MNNANCQKEVKDRRLSSAKHWLLIVKAHTNKQYPVSLPLEASAAGRATRNFRDETNNHNGKSEERLYLKLPPYLPSRVQCTAVVLRCLYW